MFVIILYSGREMLWLMVDKGGVSLLSTAIGGIAMSDST
jgi:hypothetical protein